MKRLLQSMFAALLLTGAAQAGELTGKTLRVGSDITSPPYIYFDDAKKPAGFDADVMGALAKAGGFSLQFLDTRFENLILGLNAGRFDVIASSMFVKPERAKQIDFIPYGTAGLGIAVVAGSEFKPEAIAALCGKRVGLIKGAAYIDTIRSGCTGSAKADIREFPTSAEASQALLSRNVDAQVDDVAVLKVATDKTGGKLVITSKGTIDPVVLGLGVAKAHPEIKAALEDAMKAIKADGTYQHLLETYHLTEPTAAQFEAATGQK